MRGNELKPLRLPQKVEEERKRLSDSIDSPTSARQLRQLSRSSTLSDSTSPTTATVSTRGHSRLPSSTSSLASSPAMHDSIEGFGASKRPLTDVREEPQDKDDDFEMVNAEERPSYEAEVPSTSCDADWALYQTTEEGFSPAYDFTDEPTGNDFTPHPCAKRRRADDVPLSPMDGLTSRLGSRMPSFSRSISRKFKSRKASPTIGMPDLSREPSRSRANSTRAPSLSGSVMDTTELKAVQLPPTPRRSVADERFEEAYLALSNTDKTNASQIEEEDEVVDRHAKPTTPLLPPIMTEIPAEIREVPYQSPLQSPSVANPEAPSVLNSPLPTPRIAGLPSPPLSSKPSVSSFHRQRGLGPVPPTADIPPMRISEPEDKWADQLGHANFVIHPEPYVARDTTLMACKQLRADWEIAQSKYADHLVCIGENYGTTSNIYSLTEEKWSEIDAMWKQNVELSFSRIPQLTQGTEAAIAPQPQIDTVAAADMSSPLTNMSSSSETSKKSPKVDCKFANFGEGKFPALGDGGIVGPMEVVAPLEPQKRKRKLGFFRWMQGVWPAGAGPLGRRLSSAH